MQIKWWNSKLNFTRFGFSSWSHELCYLLFIAAFHRRIEEFISFFYILELKSIFPNKVMNFVLNFFNLECRYFDIFYALFFDVLKLNLNISDNV